MKKGVRYARMRWTYFRLSLALYVLEGVTVTAWVASSPERLPNATLVSIVLLALFVGLFAVETYARGVWGMVGCCGTRRVTRRHRVLRALAKRGRIPPENALYECTDFSQVERFEWVMPPGWGGGSWAMNDARN